jgi:hypothetical protein
MYKPFCKSRQLHVMKELWFTVLKPKLLQDYNYNSIPTIPKIDLYNELTQCYHNDYNKKECQMQSNSDLI